MPRIRQYDEKYTKTDFQTEIRRKQGHYDLMSCRSLSQAVGIPHSTLNPKINDPFKFTVEDFRKLVPVLHPDPAPVLALLGYSKKDIEQFKASCGKG